MSFGRLLPMSGSVVQFEVSDGLHDTVIKSWQFKGFDSDFCFADSAWVGGSRVVIAMFRDCLHEPAEMFAFDRRKRTAVG